MDSESKDPIINQCPECSQDLDVTELAPFSKIECPFCHSAVRVRARLGQYEIKRLLGEGGMSQVFEARDLTLGRKVALKILHQSLSQDSKLTEMFEREAKLTASINHPNVVKVYTVGSENGYFYIAMELVAAVSVEQMIASKGALSEEKVLKIAYDVVSGLKAAYQGNLIHRDIKPGNMLVTKDGTTKLVDFGLAVAQGGADENEDIWATPFYVPPEKLVREPDTYLGDIYALGATCYHAIAGKPPFMANTSSLEELIAIKSAELDLQSAAPEASKPTVQLFEQMMAHNASHRPTSYDELLEKIQSCREQLGFTGTITPRSKAKRKGVVLTAGLIFVAVAIGAGLLMLKGRESNSEELDSLLVGTGDRVISAEEREAAGKMLDGREAMIRERFGDARRIFESLGGEKSLTQPTKAWNTFNQGLIELMIGNETKARDHFAKLSDQDGFENAALEKYEVFFKSMGKVLSDPLPVLRSDISPNTESFESIGLLAAGLKNWGHGQFGEADRFFQDFSKVKAPDSDPWIGEMIPLVRVYRTDYQTFVSLPNPSKKMSVSQLKTAKRQLEQSMSSLRSRGAMRQVIKARIDRADEFIKSASPPRPAKSDSKADHTSGDSKWTDEELKELSEFQKAVDGFSGYKSTYLFSGAVLRINGLEAKTPKGKALQQDLVAGYRSADRFIESLSQRLNSGTYEGTILRKKGVPLDAQITTATPEAFTVDLGFGPNEVEIEQFEPRWMVQAAEETLDPPSQSNIESWKEVFWFANACGLTEDANRIAGKLVAADKAFLEAGKRFRRINF